MQSSTHTHKHLCLHAKHSEIHTYTHQTWQSQLCPTHTHGYARSVRSYLGASIIHTSSCHLLGSLVSVLSLSLFLALSFRTDLCVRAASIKQSRAERQINPEWYPRLTAGAGGNITTSWYSYAQHLTHKRYLWAGGRHADVVQATESHCETRGGRERDLKGRGLNGWMRQGDNKWKLKGMVTQKEKERRRNKGYESVIEAGCDEFSFLIALQTEDRPSSR